MKRLLLIIGLIFALMLPMTVSASPVLSAGKARQMLIRDNAYIQYCHRLSPTHIRCYVRYWEEATEEECKEGNCVVVNRFYFFIPARDDVGLKGIKVTEL